jgi:hypothetical protein
MENNYRWRGRQQRAAEALIAPKDFVAASAERAQLNRGFDRKMWNSRPRVVQRPRSPFREG